jgi:Creatinine amidohydrolase
MSEPAPTMTGLPRQSYGEHTWLELRELARRDDVVVVIPTATLEDHGYHLPIDTDVRLIEAIASGAVERFNRGVGGRAMLFPTAVHGFTPAPYGLPGHGQPALERVLSSRCSTAPAVCAVTASIASCCSTATARTRPSSTWRRG